MADEVRAGEPQVGLAFAAGQSGAELTESSIRDAVTDVVTQHLSALALAITSQTSAAVEATTGNIMATLQTRGVDTVTTLPGGIVRPADEGHSDPRERKLRWTIEDLTTDNTMLAVLGRRDIPELYRYLQQEGLSQRHIAAATGQEPGEIHEILHKGRQVHAYDLLVQIANGLGIPRGLMGLAYFRSISTRDDGEITRLLEDPIEATTPRHTVQTLIARLATIVSLQATQEVAALLRENGIEFTSSLIGPYEPLQPIARQRPKDRLPDAMIRLIDDPLMVTALRTHDISTVFSLLQQRGVGQREIGRYTKQLQPEVSEITRGRSVRQYDLLARIARGLGVPRERMGLAYSADAVVPLDE